MQCGIHKHAQKTGWLQKRGGRIQTWHKRWFVLTGDMLFYYKSNQDSRPTGTIALAGNNVVRHQDDPRQPNSFKFEIVAGSGRSFITSTHDSYLISAESVEEANSWVAAIKRALHEPYGGGMFGRKLEETMQVEVRLGGSYIPVLVHRCAKFIINNGLEEVGIFRLPGQTSRVQALKEQYDQGSQKDISQSEDVHTVASLMKLYLRELPEPVIPHALFDNCVNILKTFEEDQNQATEDTKFILRKLPYHNYNLLKYICRFLHMVSLRSDANKMNHGNLGTVFGPNLMTPATTNPKTLIESSNVSASFISNLIRSQHVLFPITSDESPPKRLSIVSPMDIGGWQDTVKNNNKVGGSLMLKSPGTKGTDSIRSETRSRLGSVPTRLMSPTPVFDGSSTSTSTSKIKPHKFLQRLDSPIRSRKHFFSNQEANPSVLLECGSGRISPIMTSSPSFFNEDEPTNNSNSNHIELTNNESATKHTGNESEDSSSSPEILSRFSSIQGLERGSNTFSPEIVVNSIAREMESMEKELKVVKMSLCKKKKEASLWKSRYEQERRARLAAEDQIHGLQSLVDQTFQQFALDDSDDDFDEEDDEVVGGHGSSGCGGGSSSSPFEEDSFEDTGQQPLLITENGFDESHSIIPLTPDFNPRHIRAQSTQ